MYNIGGGQPENLLDYISTLQEELVRAGVLPDDYGFEGHRELVGSFDVVSVIVMKEAGVNSNKKPTKPFPKSLGSCLAEPVQNFL